MKIPSQFQKVRWHSFPYQHAISSDNRNASVRLLVHSVAFAVLLPMAMRESSSPAATPAPRSSGAAPRHSSRLPEGPQGLPVS